MASQLAFFGWLVFLVSYIPVEVCLFIFARCSVFYYYYPAACGVGLMVDYKLPFTHALSPVPRSLLRRRITIQ